MTKPPYPPALYFSLGPDGLPQLSATEPPGEWAKYTNGMARDKPDYYELDMYSDEHSSVFRPAPVWFFVDAGTDGGWLISSRKWIDSSN